MILKNFNNEISQDLKIKVLDFINDLDMGHKKNYDDFLWFLNNINYQLLPIIQEKACLTRNKIYGNSVFIRGLIEISNYCQRNCFYCGIRKSNDKVVRYRYSQDQIISIATQAYQNGYHTIVMQGGEDLYYTDDILKDIIVKIKELCPGIAITLSLGEKNKDSYQNLFDCGVDRYLLRHESASNNHYQKLHPVDMSLANRMNCLHNLKAIGYQAGAGLMIGSPFQTNEDLATDLLFLQNFQPAMIGMGPYMSHVDTPFKNQPNGTLDHILLLYSIARLICPKALIPSTTATSSLDKLGRLKALQSGCNVIMINLSDLDKRQSYTLYNNKSYLGDESHEYLKLIKSDIMKAGMIIDFSVGHNIEMKGNNNG
ncbi:MAG: [FeFe] hydrogenase H-cluster radical SAM maturase HydE [Bacilli bacterium]|jgi:biotin synthase|nr:[FeFe] hydrogenase H-cluster radical SAM maturase HydE [Bacilli bacterium]